MTVSLKRLVAFVALIAMALAGTPTKAVANDGLKSDRYGFKSKQQKVQVARQTPANLNHNPFRDDTVSATLSGASIRIDRDSVTETNVAVLLTEGTTRHAIARKPANVDHSICQIHMPVFENVSQGSFYQAWLGTGQMAIESSSRLYDIANRQIGMAMAAEREFYKSLTATSQAYAAPISKQASASTPARKVSSAKILNISTASMEKTTSFRSRPTNMLQRRTSPNVMIELLEVATNEPFQPGQHLLIEEYLPPAYSASGEPTMAKATSLSVPAMSIGFQRKVPAKTITSRSLINSAKAIIKSIIQTIEPMIGVRKAASIPQKVNRQLYQIDDLIWSTSNLKQLWSNWGAYQ